MCRGPSRRQVAGSEENSGEWACRESACTSTFSIQCIDTLCSVDAAGCRAPSSAALLLMREHTWWSSCRWARAWVWWCRKTNSTGNFRLLLWRRLGSWHSLLVGRQSGRTAFEVKRIQLVANFCCYSGCPIDRGTLACGSKFGDIISTSAENLIYTSPLPHLPSYTCILSRHTNHNTPRMPD